MGPPRPAPWPIAQRPSSLPEVLPLPGVTVRNPLLVPLVLLSVLCCDQSALSPVGNLDGAWQWQFNANPSGSNISFSLATTGPMVAGTGRVCGIGPACSPGLVTITGQCDGMSFEITIQGDSDFAATYAGRLMNRNTLSGTWIEGTDSNTVVFYRK
jgi:hypothetical protein